MTAPQHKLRVGVTLSVREGAQSIWENGVFQNCAFLSHLLNRSPAVSEAVLVNTTGFTPNPALLLDLAGVRMVNLEEAAQTLDVAIEMSATFPDDWAAAFRARGGRSAWMRVGNDYVIDIERAMHGKQAMALTRDSVFDAIWTIPEYVHSCTESSQSSAVGTPASIPSL